MTITKRIAVGVRVEGKHGPLIDNPSGGKRRIRMKVFGTVLRATEKGEWEVRFDFDGRQKVVRNNTLCVIDNNDSVPLGELEAVITTKTSSEATNLIPIMDGTPVEGTTVSTEVCIIYLVFVFFKLLLTILFPISGCYYSCWWCFYYQ